MEKLSLYAQYVLEREGAHIIEYDWGFAIYHMKVDHVYLQDIFVVQSERKSGKGVQLMHEVAAKAKEAGINMMIGSVAPSTPFADAMFQIMQGLGFKLLSSSHDMVYLSKEI